MTPSRSARKIQRRAYKSRAAKSYRQSRQQKPRLAYQPRPEALPYEASVEAQPMPSLSDEFKDAGFLPSPQPGAGKQRIQVQPKQSLTGVQPEHVQEILEDHELWKPVSSAPRQGPRRLVFIAGAQESGKDAVVELLARGGRSVLPAFTLLSASRFVPQQRASSLHDLEQIREAVERGIATESGKGDAHLLVSGPLMVRTPHGLLPAARTDFFRKLRPDMILLLEKHIPRIYQTSGGFVFAPKGVRPENLARLAQLRSLQEANRAYALACAQECGSLLKIVKIREGGVKDALKETLAALRFALQ